ncbi:RNA polymerase subunit sigma-70 [Antrihabitans cavernicola]|uniref:Sigma-70 family RNA polymerase sigma factor n=1 Tax=Antrihabitans cavernicola TaxID=2495913 RepID=A0A5A7S6S3_9NOCA|nr:RNA polymerase subunit sigma-70 [Spelaeibacter cavernicola]KAA0018975.1 sigma-70 family RNA polymerase sigma factor [Spelaeibacter cavernicola]
MNEIEFAGLVDEHKRGLHQHCYRMLGSLHDAEEALQETWIAAWKGIDAFEGRSKVRTWLYTIATRCCLRHAERQPPRLLSWEHGPSREPEDDLGEPIMDSIWLDPWPSDPGEAAPRRETIGLAYVASLQHLPPNQRAVLLLSEVLAFSAAEVAGMLDTSTASVNSALQRARATVSTRVTAEPVVSDDERVLLDSFVDAWERADVDALVEMLSEGVKFTMPPLLAWYDGRDAVLGFVERKVFATQWKLVPVVANGQPAYACYQGPDFKLGAINVLTVEDGKISWIAAFVDPAVTAQFGLPEYFPADR